MSPNYASAYILNNLVKAYNKTFSTVDYSTSIKEYGLALNNTEINLRLLYGLSALYSNSSSNIVDILVFGKGLCKINSLSNIVELPNSTSNTEGIKLSDILSTNTEISNCYVFGAIYLTTSGSGENIEISLAKFTNNVAGTNVILSKDISIDEAQNILLNSTDIVFPQPTGSANTSVMLYKFIVDVDIYKNIFREDRATIKLVDIRKPRGYFGLTDEILFATMATKIIDADNDINILQTTALDTLQGVVKKWVETASWNPDFVSYWTSANPSIPSELKDFLAAELGIII
jgi:hypothetical protein